MRQNQQQRPTRRIIGWIGLLSVLFILLSALAYLYSTHSGFARVVGNAFSQQTPTPTLPPITCKTPAHKTGDSIQTLTSNGIERNFLVHLAPSYGRQPQPLVISYHGYNQTAQVMERYSAMDQEANKAHFVLVLPLGLDTTWSAGIGTRGPTGDADDVQFTRDLLKLLTKDYCIDTQRVYLTGFSLGGGMAYRLACTLSDQITAIATIAGAFYTIPGGCHPSRPVPILEFHGGADDQALYNGNPTWGMASVHDYLSGWLERDKCNPDGNVFFQQGTITATEWTHCASGVKVVHYRIDDLKHSYPRAIDTNAVIWSFFSQFSLP